MRYLLIILFVLLIPLTTEAKFPVTKSILAVCTHLSWNKAYGYAIPIFHISKKYGIDWKIVVAIFAQESACGRYKRGGCHISYIQSEINTSSDSISEEQQTTIKIWEKITACKDYGITQINASNIKRHGLDIDRLDTDPEYAFNWTIKYLVTLKKRHKHDALWYCRYNSSTKEYKYKYCEKLQKFLDKMVGE